MTRFRRCAALLVLLVVAAPVRAEPTGGPEAQARAHFVAGQQAYAAGRYAEALRQFELGYALSPRPEFLINFAQAHRKLGQYDRAIVECERFLSTSPPPEVRAGAERLLASLREEQAQAALATSQPPESPAAPPSARRLPPAAAPTERPPAPTAPPAPVAPVPERKAEGGGRKATWLAIGIVGGVLVVGAAVTLGIVLAPARDVYPDTPLGRVDFR